MGKEIKMADNPREKKCHYCGELMGDECHYVIKSGDLIMAHKRCHDASQAEESNLRIIIKGNSCSGGICRR